MERLQGLAGAASWNIGSFISPTAFLDFCSRIKTKRGLFGLIFRVLHSSIEMFSSWAPGLSYYEPLTHSFSRRFTWWASLLNDSGCVVQNWKIIVPHMGKDLHFKLLHFAEQELCFLFVHVLQVGWGVRMSNTPPLFSPFPHFPFFFYPSSFLPFTFTFYYLSLFAFQTCLSVVIPKVRVPFFLDFQDNPSSPATELQLELQSKFIQVK